MKSFIKIIIIGLLLFINVNDIKSQIKGENYYSVKAGAGKILKSCTYMDEAQVSYFSAFEFGKKNIKSNKWDSYLNLPEYGFEMIYGNLRNDFLGSVFGIQPYIKLPLIRNKNFEINLNGGLGFAYFTEKYHFFDNRKNCLIGSNITNYTRAELELAYSTGNFKIFTNTGIFHFSNGHVKLPNVGANVPQFKIGLSQFYNNYKKQEYDKRKRDTTWFPGLRYSYGLHSYGSTMKPFGSKMYSVNSLSAILNKNINEVYMISGGITLSNYNAYQNLLLSELKLNNKSAFIKSSVITIFFGQEIKMGKLSLYGEFGIDIYKEFIREYGDIFDKEKGFSKIAKSYNSNRLGLKYYIINKENNFADLSIGLMIKSNYAQAEFTEFLVQMNF